MPMLENLMAQYPSVTSVVLWHWLGEVGIFAEDLNFDGVGEGKATVG